jgi:MFS transporter, ACS family, D-galactonate transporter
MNRRWTVLALIFAGILVSYVDRGNLSIAATAVMRDFKLPPASMGLLLSAFFWTYALFQIPAGFAVDRFGIRRVYAGAFFIWSLASAGIALSRGMPDILGLRMLLGFAETVGPIASLAFIRQNFKGPEQGLPTSIYVSGQTLGPAIGTLLGATLLTQFGWRFMFAATGLGAMLWLPWWLYYAPRGKAKPPSQGTPSAPWTRSTVNAVIASPTLWAMSACVFFFSYYWYFVLTWMPAYLTMARGYSTMGMGRILSAPLFAMAVTNIITGWAADKLATRYGSVFRVRVLFTAAGLLGAGSILLLQVLPGHAVVLPILVISICSFGVASANYWAIAQHTPPAHMVGRTIGYLNTISQIGGVAAPLITGWSLGPQKHFGFAIVLAGVTPLVACALLLAAGPRGLEKLQNTLLNAAPLAGAENPKPI